MAQPREQSHERADRTWPMPALAARNSTAQSTISAIPPAERGGARPPAAEIAPAITARTTRPRTSSMTAAPRIVWPSPLWTAPRSRSTRAVMPTLVAASVAPMNRWTSSGLPGSSHAVTPQPSATGATTPNTATRSAEGPTRTSGAQVGLQPDLEEQQQHTHLCQDVQGGVGSEELGAVPPDDEWHEVAQAHAHQQLAEHRGLSPPLGDEAADLRRGHEQGDGEERRPDPAAVAASGGPRRRDDEDDAEPHRPARCDH